MDMTVKEIKAVLDKHGIDYDKRARKDDLLALLPESEKTPKEYVVIKRFRDAQDGKRVYEPKNAYPRQGVKVTQERIDELLSSNNKQGEPLIKERD